ncbi:hypothetical protein ACFSSA_03385 [Luteolibacter algae]|uniref:Uncharacterized protein n=1 Tax=Luteolibacter algae TaxID=454151 RepID=A0ABW5D5T3_9BACT
MPTKSQSPRKLLLTAILAAGILLAAVLVYGAYSRSRERNNEIALLGETARNSSGPTAADLSRSNPASATVVEAASDDLRPARTKSNRRENAESAAGTMQKNGEFWSTAKLPSNLVVASLPILQAALTPAGNESADGATDYATEVPAAFGGDGDFDYRKANEDLYNWLLTDPQAATDWISGQSDYSKYDMAFGMIADTMALNGYLDTAKEWISLIPNRERQHDATINMYAGIYSRGGDVPSHLTNEIKNSDKID